MFGSPYQGEGKEIQLVTDRMQLMSMSRARYGWRSSLGVTHGDRFPKVGTQQFPSWEPTVALDQTAQGQDGLSASLGPGHPRLLHALSDQGFARGFDHPTRNRQSLTEIFGVVHARVLIPKVGQLGLQSFAPVSLGSTAVILQHPNSTLKPGLVFLEQRFQALELRFAAGRAFAAA